MNNYIKKFLKFDHHGHSVDKIAGINSLFSGIALFPQFFKLATGSSIAGVSLTTFILISLNSLIWILYGYHRKTFPLLISSALNFIASTGIIIIVFLK